MPGVVSRPEYMEESAEVEVLFANMDKLKALTRKIQGSLNRLESNARSVQDAVNPIYSNTRKLQVTSGNIDKINEAINKIREPLDRKRREETIIKGGLQQAGLVDYLAALDRAHMALGDLRNSNLRSNQQAISDLTGLLKLGSQQLENSFREILQQESQPIEPLGNLMKNTPFPTISESNSSTLRQINAHVATNTPDARTLGIYADIRSQYLVGSLQRLALSSVGTVKKKDPDALYQKGECGIATHCNGIEGMFVAESNNIFPIFAREHWSHLFSETCTPALNEFSKVLRELHNHIKEHLVTDCFLAYEIVGVVQDLSYRLETKARTSELKQPIQHALRPIRETAKYSLQRLLEDTKARVQGLMLLPQDGSTSPITTEAMTRLQCMTPYFSTLSSIFVSVGDGGWRGPDGTPGSSIKSFDVGNDGRDLFSNYTAETIDSLLTALENKGKVLLKNRSVQGIFIANNVAVIERMVLQSELHTLLNEAARAKIDSWRKKGIQLCLGEWREPSIHLRDVQYTNRTSGQHPPTGAGPHLDSAAYVKSLGSKEKDAIKEKFRSFNTSFDELVARHKTFRTEPEVKVAVARDIQAMIEPLYARFWDRYHEIDKGKGKYVKYDKNQLISILSQLG